MTTYKEAGAASLMPADNVSGFKAEMIRLLKEQRIEIARWPGANVVSANDCNGLTWEGVGPIGVGIGDDETLGHSVEWFSTELIIVRRRTKAGQCSRYLQFGQRGRRVGRRADNRHPQESPTRCGVCTASARSLPVSSVCIWSTRCRQPPPIRGRSRHLTTRHESRTLVPIKEDLFSFRVQKSEILRRGYYEHTPQHRDAGIQHPGCIGISSLFCRNG